MSTCWGRAKESNATVFSHLPRVTYEIRFQKVRTSIVGHPVNSNIFILTYSNIFSNDFLHRAPQAKNFCIESRVMSNIVYGFY